MNKFRRVLFGVLSLSASGALVAGCGPASSSSSGSGPASPTAIPTTAAPTTAPSPSGASPSASSSSLPAGSGPLGSQLGRALLPLSALPAGFKDNPSGDRNSGPRVPHDSPSPVPQGKVCDTLGSAALIEDSTIATSAFAETDYVTTDSLAEISEEADTFTGDDAETAMNTLWQDMGECSVFGRLIGDATDKVTITRKKLSGAGDAGFEGVELIPAAGRGTTIVAIRVGKVIITTVDSSPKSDDGGAAVGYARAITANLSKFYSG